MSLTEARQVVHKLDVITGLKKKTSPEKLNLKAAVHKTFL